MSASHHSPATPQVTTARRPAHVDWAAQIRLAIVLSLCSAIATAGLARHFSATVLVAAVFLVCSAVAWARHT
jgi:hypothetical protein